MKTILNVALFMLVLGFVVAAYSDHPTGAAALDILWQMLKDIRSALYGAGAALFDLAKT